MNTISENSFEEMYISSTTLSNPVDSETFNNESKMETSGIIKTSIKEMMELEKFKKEIEHEKKGLEFSIGLVKGLLGFLVFVSLVKLMKQAEGSNITIDLNEYFSLLLPIITTALGYILGKKSN